jgi:glycosyltransferase involved in cell wall biosynthesis
MHVCFLNTPAEYYSPISGGAIATIIMQVSRQLIARGHRVSIVTIVNDDPPYGVGEIVPISVPVRKDLSFLKRRISSLRRAVNEWDWPYYGYYLKAFQPPVRALQPDAVVLFNDLVSAKYLRQALPQTRIAVWLQNEWRTNQRKTDQTVACTDVFLTCSDYIRRWTATTYQIPEDRFRVAHSGVDLEEFKPRSPSPVSKGSAAPLRVLFIGRIDPNKGPDIAADAVAILRKRGVEVQLTVAGGRWWYGHGNEMEDPYFRLLKSKMEAAGANYLGHVVRAAVPALVREHDVVCILSRSNEPFALVTLEAMASGCAVIASDRGGLPESCGGAATLVDPDDLGAVAEAILALANDRELLARQRKKSLERARRAPWPACADVVEQALLCR